jgi:hypothetical protein
VPNAIFTPRGLHIRLPPELAFGLMAQLRPRVRPAEVLATVEAIEFTPTALSKLLGLACFLVQPGPMATAAIVCAGRVLPNLLALSAPDALTGLARIGRWYRPIAGHGISLIVVAIAGLLLAGPVTAAGFVIGTGVGGALNMLVDFALMRRADARLNRPLSSTERFFLTALRRHAAAEPDLRPEAVEPEAWRAALDDYAAACPERARQSVA